MNYLAHGRRFLDEPYFVAGTAIPDWLNVVDRRTRARARVARQYIADLDPRIAALAQGIVQHHHDDDWFHCTRAFVELSLQFTLAVRNRIPSDHGFRPSFLGHILVELLLDAVLAEDRGDLLDRYYSVLQEVDPELITRAVSQMTGRNVASLAWLIPRFLSERFLCDYLDDGKLLARLNHVMHRVGLPELPGDLVELFPAARDAVRRRRIELLAGEAVQG